jgi:predicted MFS family arabinose efflux permease
VSPSSRLRRVYLLSFVESFAGVLLQRGLYFYTHDELGFGESQNLWLALASGIAYVIGAMSSHRVALRISERWLLMATLIGPLVLHTLLTQNQSTLLLIATFPLIGMLQGFKWPVVESYLSAGLPPRELVRTLARFNVVWASSVPIGLVAAGQLIGTAYPGALFAAAAASNVLSVATAWPLPRRPEHLPDEHPERPNENELRRLGKLLGSARWCMLSSYALMFLLAPLMPTLFAELGLDVGVATAAAGLLDVARLACFAWLGRQLAWRGRTWPHVAAILALPIGFALVLLGNTLSWVIAGEALFGLAAGFVYTAALYYAQLVKNASVDAGGAHEGLIGLGFALGPLAGLAGSFATRWMQNHSLATLACTAPFVLAFGVLSLRPLLTSSSRVPPPVPNSNA